MKTLQNIISIITITILCSCKNSLSNNSEATQIDSIDSEITSISDQIGNPLALTNEEEESDKFTTIKFNELSITINRSFDFDNDNEIDQIQKDTVQINAQFGEQIEGQLISISSNLLTGLTLEQRYETSVSILNEGKSCHLTDWKHFYSDWKQLKLNNSGQFIFEEYAEKEAEKFPEINIDDLKQKVKDHCGNEYLILVENVKTITDYPIDVSISRYYLKVTGQRKDNGETVSKLIILIPTMGC